MSTPDILSLQTSHFLLIVGDPAFGGDIGFELSFAFSAIVYPIARVIERRLESPDRLRVRSEGKL